VKWAVQNCTTENGAVKMERIVINNSAASNELVDRVEMYWPHLA